MTGARLVSDVSIFKLYFIWDQSGIFSSNRLEIRAVLRKTIMIKMRVFQLKLYILVLLKIDVVDKLLRLDQWNFYTKNVKHNTTREKWFEIIDWLRLGL